MMLACPASADLVHIILILHSLLSINSEVCCSYIAEMSDDSYKKQPFNAPSEPSGYPDSKLLALRQKHRNVNNDDDDDIPGYNPVIYSVCPEFWHLFKAFDNPDFERIARHRPTSFLRETCMIRKFTLPKYVVLETNDVDENRSSNIKVLCCRASCRYDIRRIRIYH